MRFPDFLKPNDVIGFVAPSFGCTTEPYHTSFLHGLEVLKKRGYQTLLGPNCFATEGIGISNTPEKCGRELTEFYCSPASKILISCGGGELMCEDLDFVDFDRIRNAVPKWYMGFSDNTNFTFLVTTICDVASIYGPCADSFGMEPMHRSISDALMLLEGKKNTVEGYRMWQKEPSADRSENPLVPYLLTEPTIIRRFFCSETENVHLHGRLIGGCLDCLSTLAGTSFDHAADFAEHYKQDGILWYLEACDLNVMSIRRALWHMKHAGWFQHASGFLIGRSLAAYGEELMGLDSYHAFTDALAEYGVPVIMDIDLGHLPPAMPLINGSFADAELSGNNLRVTMQTK